MNLKSRVLIAIPARGGSKRLARKNLLPLGRRPMIAHTIEAARKSGLTETVFVCTEDDEIAKTAEEFGAAVHRIPMEMAGDLVSSTSPCLHLAEALIREGHKVEYLFNLQPSSPLRTAEDLRESFETLKKSRADFLVSATPIDPHYFHWALKENESGWKMYFGGEFLKERPLLPPVMRPNGAIKLARYDKVKGNGNFFGNPLTIHEMPDERSIHVATSFDYACAQAVLATGGDDV